MGPSGSPDCGWFCFLILTSTLLLPRTLIRALLGAPSMPLNYTCVRFQESWAFGRLGTLAERRHLRASIHDPESYCRNCFLLGMVNPRSWPTSRCSKWLPLRLSPQEGAIWPLAFYHISNSCSISSRAVLKSFTWLLCKICYSTNWALSSSFIFNFTFRSWNSSICLLAVSLKSFSSSCKVSNNNIEPMGSMWILALMPGSRCLNWVGALAQLLACSSSSSPACWVGSSSSSWVSVNFWATAPGKPPGAGS